MIQCLVCEDWFHESCCNLRERPSSRVPSPVLESSDSVEQADDTASEISSTLPPPLISGADYESFVCANCVFGQESLRKWAGTPGATLVVRDSMDDPWRLEPIPSCDNDVSVSAEEPAGTSTTGSKRSLSPSDGSPETKRIRTSYDTTKSKPKMCLAPPSNPVASKIYGQGIKAALSASTSLGAGDIFFMEGFRDRWCHCATCLPFLHAHPYLLEEENTYEPPEDPDSSLSLEELGMRALERIPRDRAIDGIHAFQEMRNDLMNFLRPFAQEGKVVRESDVRGFFESLKENSKNAQS